MLPGLEGPPHLVQRELKQRQRARAIQDRSRKFLHKSIRDPYAAQRRGDPHDLVQLVTVHAAQRYRVLPQPFTEARMADEKGPERVLPQVRTTVSAPSSGSSANCRRNQLTVLREHFLELINHQQDALATGLAPASSAAPPRPSRDRRSCHASRSAAGTGTGEPDNRAKPAASASIKVGRGRTVTRPQPASCSSSRGTRPA